MCRLSIVMVSVLALFGCVDAQEPAGAPSAHGGSEVELRTDDGTTVLVTSEQAFEAEVRPVSKADTEAGPIFPAGYTLADHVEVAPGVFVLREQLDAGQIAARSVEQAGIAARARGDLPYRSNDCLRGGNGALAIEHDEETDAPVCLLCQDFDLAFSQGSASLFPAGVVFEWYDLLVAEHFSVECNGEVLESETQVYVELGNFASLPSSIQKDADIYVNGEYVATLSGAVFNGTQLLLAALLEIECENMVTVEAQARHRFVYAGFVVMVETPLGVTLDCTDCVVLDWPEPVLVPEP